MKYSIDQILVATSHTDEVKNQAFTRAVMKRLRTVPPSAIMQNASKGGYFRLRYLPKFVAVILAVIVIAAISGTAYAVFTLWPKPSVQTQPAVINQFGRTQIIASFDNCNDTPKEATYEIKKGSTLAPSEVAHVLQAKCESDVIRSWVSSMPNGEPLIKPASHPIDGEVKDHVSLSSVAAEVVLLNATQLALAPTGNLDTDNPVDLSPDTKFIVNGNEAKREDIKSGDAVFFVQNARQQFSVKPRGDGSFTFDITTLKKETTYVIKVDQPAIYYQAIKQDQIIARKPCSLNPQDSCLDGGVIDVYQNLDLYENFTKDQQAAVIVRTIQGKIVGYKDDSLTLQASSGRIFTLTLPNDIVSSFNTKDSSTYHSLQIKPGDILNVTYYDVNKDTYNTALEPEHILTVTLVVDFIDETYPVKKY